ncbi:MAG: arylesterase [Leptospiraceae bacterium]|nr:arylesterase [Leptospiraceae bacterium]
MKKESKPRLIFFGDSLTAGYKLPSEAFSFPSLIYAKLKKEGYSYEYVNAGLSGDTTSGGLERLDWVISEGVDVFVLELGANDSMRGIPIPLIKKNLTAIIQKVRDKNPKVKILLVPMRTFPNLGPRYTQDFYKLYVEISKKENVPLSPFLLEKVAGIPSLNQSDGIHPTVKGHELLAETLYPSVQKLLAK